MRLLNKRLFLGANGERADRSIAIALFLLVFGVYGATLCRTLYTGDDGDFITAMSTFGVAHPTGYPLFTLLGRLFINVLPFSNPALDVNVMTALFGAASVALFYRFAALIVPSEQRFFAATAALLFAFSPTLWQQSLSCEVYSLTCLFLAALLYLAALWHQTPQDTRESRGLLRLLAFVYGLSLTNHLTMALFLPGFLFFVLTRRKSLLWREGKLLCSLVGLFVLPLTLYAYLPLAGMGEPPVYWGAPGKWATFWEHITGKAYHGALASSAEVIFYNARKYAGYFMSQYGWWFLWLLPVGMASLWQNRERRTLLLLLLYIAAVNIAYSVHYNIFDIYVYYLPSYLITAALLAVGAVKAMTWMWDRRGLDAPSRLHYARLAAIVALTYPIVQMSLHYAQTDKSRNFLEQDFSANVLRSAPENALVISGSNLVFSLWYQRFVLGEREDVVPINWSMTRGMFLYDAWYYRHLKRLYPDIKNTYASGTATIEQAANGDFLIAMIKRAVQKDVAVILVNDIGSRSVLFTEKLNREFDRVPWGIGERVYFKGRTPSAGEIVRANEAIWPTLATRGLYTGWGHADPMQQHITLRYADAGLALGKMAEKAGRYQTASEAYRSTLRLYRSDDAEAGLARCSQALSAAPRQVSQAPRNRSVQR